jgi:two-component system KDP operon response regulator KdpE
MLRVDAIHQTNGRLLAQTEAESSKPRILVVDDEKSIRWALRQTLQSMNFEITEAESGEQAVALVRTVRFDAVLLDIAMPGMDGIEACRLIRQVMPNIGIVMLSVRSFERDKVEALDAGADDYVTKPFPIKELAARLRSAVRRFRVTEPESSEICIGEVELDPQRRLVKKAGVSVHLTPREYELLYYLMSHAGIRVTHARLLSALWGPEYGGEVEYLRTFMRQLRKKLGDDAGHPKYLITESHVGYRFATKLELENRAAGK